MPPVLTPILDTLAERAACPAIPRRGKGRFKWYRDVYLRSHHWSWVRARVKERAEGVCQRCRTANGLHVHHDSYRRLWREHPSDLELLCADCHERRHRSPGGVRGTDFSPVAWVFALLLSPLFAIFGALFWLFVATAQVCAKVAGRLAKRGVPPVAGWVIAAPVGLLVGVFGALGMLIGVPLLILALPFVLLALRVRLPFLEKPLKARWDARRSELIANRWQVSAERVADYFSQGMAVPTLAALDPPIALTAPAGAFNGGERKPLHVNSRAETGTFRGPVVHLPPDVRDRAIALMLEMNQDPPECPLTSELAGEWVDWEVRKKNWHAGRGGNHPHNDMPTKGPWPEVSGADAWVGVRDLDASSAVWRALEEAGLDPKTHWERS